MALVVAPRDHFWSGRRVFLTGHTGFKGAWLTLLLNRLGAVTHGYAQDPPTRPSLFDLTGAASTLATDTRADILDAKRLEACMKAAEPEIVLHLAAQPLVRLSYREPVRTFAENVMGTAHVLEAVRHTPSVRAVVSITTDKCYENKEWVWGYREDDRLGGHDPYSNSKACAELVCQSFRDSFFPHHRYADHRVALATARAGNAIGGGDWASDRLIPDAIRAMGAGQSLEIRYPGATRPWQHLLDPLSGYLVLAERLVQDGADFGEGWNFGPDAASERTVAEVLTALTDRWSGRLHWHRSPGEHPHEAGFLKLDCAKAAARLGWRSKIGFEAAMALTADWYGGWSRGDDLRQLTDDQINNFLGTDAHA